MADQHRHDTEDDWTHVDERNARFVAMTPENMRTTVRNLLQSYTNAARTIDPSIKAYAGTHVPGCDCAPVEHMRCLPMEAMAIVEGVVRLITLVSAKETGHMLGRLGDTIEAKRIELAAKTPGRPKRSPSRKTKR